MTNFKIDHLVVGCRNLQEGTEYIQNLFNVGLSEVGYHKSIGTHNRVLKIGKIYVDVNTSWLNPLKVRTLTIIGKKKMLQFDELNLKNPVKIFNKYAKYPNLSKFDKKFLKSKVKIYLGNSKNVKIKVSSPLENELKHFFTSIQKRVKPKTDVKFAYNILKFLDRIN